MDKELKDLLNNYEKVIYGQASPTTPTTHHIHLLLDYIANLEQQIIKKKEVINKANKYLCELLHEAYLEESSNIDIALTEYAVDILKEGKNE